MKKSNSKFRKVTDALKDILTYWKLIELIMKAYLFRKAVLSLIIKTFVRVAWALLIVYINAGLKFYSPIYIPIIFWSILDVV